MRTKLSTKTEPSPDPRKIEKLPRWLREYIDHLTGRANYLPRLMRALRWSDRDDIGPDVKPPSAMDRHAPDLVKGWHFNVFSRDVYRACSSSNSHGTRQDTHTTSQNPIRLYSTRLRALRGLRAACELEFAKVLAKIDLEIEVEVDAEAESSTPPTPQDHPPS